MRPPGMWSALCLWSLLSGCESSHEATSSGGDWLQCETDADCTSASAVRCDQEGYCLDENGKRVAEANEASDDAGKPEAGPEVDAALSDANRDDDAEADADGGLESCAWGVDDRLREVGASAPDRVNCGSVAPFASGEVESLWRCFGDYRAEGVAVEASVNRCIDCLAQTTYVATATGELYSLVLRTGTAFTLGSITTNSCADVAWQEGDIRCLQPSELALCSGELGEGYPPPAAPVPPRAVVDVPAGDGPTAVLHLYVSNQGTEPAVAPIEVHLNNTHVVTGDFGLEGRATWHQFDLELPVDSYDLRALSLGEKETASFDEAFYLPEERWGVLTLRSQSAQDEASRHFTWTLHAEPVALE